MPELLGASPELVKLTVSLNIVAYGIATLVHGPLSERFGRKPVLLWGLVGFTLASFLCANAADIGQLLLARILQGVAAAVEGVVVFAIIRDVFAEKEQVRAIAIYGIATAFAPAFAPLLGGYIHVYFGWRVNFYLLTILALLVTLLIALFLKESTEKDYNALNSKEIFADYSGLLSNKSFLLYIIIGGCSLGCIFAFITAGPFILIKNHGVATEHFGYYQGVLILAYVIGSPAGNTADQDVRRQGDITNRYLRRGNRRPAIAGNYPFGSGNACYPDFRHSDYRIRRRADICRDPHSGHEFNRQKNGGCGSHDRLCGNGYRITGSTRRQLDPRWHSVADDDNHAGTYRDERPGLHKQSKIVVDCVYRVIGLWLPLITCATGDNSPVVQVADSGAAQPQD